MIPLVLLFTLLQDPVVMSGRPRAASPWVQSVRASCGGSVLTVAGYGAARPVGRAAQMLVGKRPVAGKAVQQLLDDLSHRGVVYRLTILCGHSGEINLRIDEGEKLKHGPVRYRLGTAVIKGNLLFSYTGLEESDADSFWFR